jgi:mRNA interferase RelE/StbE
MNEIRWKPKAAKQVNKFKEPAAKVMIFESVQALANFPDCESVKALKNHEYSYRLRVGDFRVFFEFDGKIRIVSVEEVRKRNERTY